MAQFAWLLLPLIFIAMKFNPREQARLFFAKRKAQAPAPKLLWILLTAGFGLTIALSTLRGDPKGQAEELGLPPTVAKARLFSLDEPVAFAKMLNLVVQAHDVQPGLSLSYGQLNYDQLVAWMDLSLKLDSAGQYPLMAGARLYTQPSADAARQRKMTEWVAARFADDPQRRWPWMAHIAYIAKTQFKDEALALRYAEILRVQTEKFASVPAWARQLDIFLRIEMKESDRAKVLIGALLKSGQIKDENELRFLAHTLQELEEGKR
jgi:hypothetical protein